MQEKILVILGFAKISKYDTQNMSDKILINWTLSKLEHFLSIGTVMKMQVMGGNIKNMYNNEPLSRIYAEPL